VLPAVYRRRLAPGTCGKNGVPVIDSFQRCAGADIGSFRLRFDSLCQRGTRAVMLDGKDDKGGVRGFHPRFDGNQCLAKRRCTVGHKLRHLVAWDDNYTNVNQARLERVPQMHHVDDDKVAPRRDLNFNAKANRAGVVVMHFFQSIPPETVFVHPCEAANLSSIMRRTAAPLFESFSSEIKSGSSSRRDIRSSNITIPSLAMRRSEPL
jgi:hypothetical protein